MSGFAAIKTIAAFKIYKVFKEEYMRQHPYPYNDFQNNQFDDDGYIYQSSEEHQ